MEPYIRKNTELRKLASSSFEKDFFKLMNNSVFGKTIENIRKRQNVILVDKTLLINYHQNQTLIVQQYSMKILLHVTKKNRSVFQ